MSLKYASILALALVTAVAVLPAAEARRPGFGLLYHDGEVVRTVVPPAASPHEGRDDFYAVPDQFGVAAVAPGDSGYHGGHWKFHSVTWNVEPYLLTSASAVLAAASEGDVTVTRVPENDFLCPIQP